MSDPNEFYCAACGDFHVGWMLPTTNIWTLLASQQIKVASVDEEQSDVVRMIAVFRESLPNLLHGNTYRCPAREEEPHLCHPDTEPPFDMMDMIMHLNDDHEWSREQIANWLDTLDVDLRFVIKDE